MTHNQVIKYVKEVCEFLGVPYIPVRKVKKISADNTAAQFSNVNNNWEIKYTARGAKKAFLGHEIEHYVNTLDMNITEQGGANEKIADATGEGLLITMRVDYDPHSMMLPKKKRQAVKT